MNSSLFPLLETIRRLRAPDGCPWDREQTHQSLRSKLVEEAYEVLDILDQLSNEAKLKNQPALKNSFIEELGDLLLQILLHSQIAEEASVFSFETVAHELNQKLIRRHPHVFEASETSLKTSGEVLQNWEKSKQKEKQKKTPSSSILDGIPYSLPALQKAGRVIDKVGSVGFQWPQLEGFISKVEEEWTELKAELKPQTEPFSALQKSRIEAELGDLLFSLCNLARKLHLDPEMALRSQVQRFSKRFRHVEFRVLLSKKSFEQTSLEEMDHFWKEAKILEKTCIYGLTGGIASGKSTLSAFFQEAGVPVINADSLAKRILIEKEDVRNQILQELGTLDSVELKKLIFQSPQARQKLEAILHPPISLASLTKMLELAPHHRLIIYDAALLVQTQRHKQLDGLLVIHAPSEVRLQRLRARNPELAPELAQKILETQLSDEILLEEATASIENAGSLEDLGQKAKTFLEQHTP